MSKQLLRCGTSVGANVSEADLHKTDYLTEKEYNSMNSDINELIALLVSITKTVKAKQKGKKDDG